MYNYLRKNKKHTNLCWHESVAFTAMRILITNDDGIYSPGIAALAKVAQKFGEVRIVAPDVEQSSMGHAVTHSRPGDGEFEIIIIPEDQRERLETFVQNKIEGSDDNITFSSLKGKDISIVWSGKHGHVDDEVVKADDSFDITIHMHEGILSFLMPAE